MNSIKIVAGSLYICMYVVSKDKSIDYVVTVSANVKFFETASSYL